MHRLLRLLHLLTFHLFSTCLHYVIAHMIIRCLCPFVHTFRCVVCIRFGHNFLLYSRFLLPQKPVICMIHRPISRFTGNQLKVFALNSRFFLLRLVIVPIRRRTRKSSISHLCLFTASYLLIYISNS